MSIKSIAALQKEVLSYETPENAYANKDLVRRVAEQRKDIERLADLAKNIVLEKVEEKEFVRFAEMIQQGTSAQMSVQGCEGILMAELEGSLTVYTHTVVLAIVGALIEDEVL